MIEEITKENIIGECEWKRNYDGYQFENGRDIDLNNIYEHAHSEMSLQQSKRDQIINIYLAMCTFIVPFVLGEKLGKLATGFIFIGVSIIGIIFSFIAIRYRIYKEIYWMCCQTLTVLQNFRIKDIDKTLVQSMFYNCLEKRGYKYLENKKGQKKLSLGKYIKANKFSAETLYFLIIALIAALISGVGVSMVIHCFIEKVLSITMGSIVAIIMVIVLMNRYFVMNFNTYKVLECSGSEEEEHFRKVFAKAWFLHIYYDSNEEKE